MTLKTSSRKINPFLGMIKSTYRKNFGIIIVLCIMALLYCPGVYVVNFENFFKDRYTLEATWGFTGADFSRKFGTIIAAFAPIFVMIFNFVNFSYLYKKNASDVFHSFPLTRAELLLSRMIAGVLSALTPVLLCTLCYVVTVIFNPWLGNFGTLLYYLAITLVITLLWSSFSMIFVVCAGSSFDLSLSFIGTNISIMFVGIIVHIIFLEKLTGYAGTIGLLLRQISIPFFCMFHSSISFWIQSIVYILAFTFVSLFLYNRRKAEKGGTAYAYKLMYYICGVLASICGGYFIGMIFDALSNDFSPVFWLFSLLGAIICSLIYGLITNRGFKGASRSLLTGVIAWVILILIVVISSFGGFGFSKRVPNKNRVETAQIYFMSEHIEFTDPDDVIALHEKTIANALKEKSLAIYEKYRYEDDTCATIDFMYTLKNGNMVNRSFYVPISSVENELLTIFKNEERYDNIVKDSFVNNPMISAIDVTYYNKSSVETECTITQEEYKALLETYWQETQTLLEPEDIYATSFTNIWFNFTIGEKKTEYYRIEIPYSFERTYQLLEKYTYSNYY